MSGLAYAPRLNPGGVKVWIFIRWGLVCCVLYCKVVGVVEEDRFGVHKRCELDEAVCFMQLWVWILLVIDRHL